MEAHISFSKSTYHSRTSNTCAFQFYKIFEDENVIKLLHSYLLLSDAAISFCKRGR